MAKESNKEDLEDIKNRLSLLENSISDIKNLLGGGGENSEDSQVFASPKYSSKSASLDDGRIVKGFFDGEKMRGEDGQEYEVPPNYASKSKLVEGDVLKLTIAADGTFIFKQIGPVERRKVIGTLDIDQNSHHKVITPEKSYRVLLASVTYFKAQAGDQITLVIPRDRECIWGAIENIIKRTLPSAGQSYSDTSLEKVDKNKEEIEEKVKIASETEETASEEPLFENSEIDDLDDLDNDRSNFTI